MSGSITDQNLMFEQKRLCGDRAYATGAEQLRECDQQVDREDEEFAHGTNATMIASTRKTAPHSRIPSYCEFATHTFAMANCPSTFIRPARSRRTDFTA
jgi:hypothetical protein